MTRAERRERAQKERETLLANMKQLSQKTALVALKKELKAQPNKAQLFRDIASNVLEKDALNEFNKFANGDTNNTKNNHKRLKNESIYLSEYESDTTVFQKFGRTKRHSIDI